MSARELLLSDRPGAGPGTGPVTGSGTGPAWAVFDAAWYARHHGVADRGLAHYLDHGQRAGHAPNPLFDEAFYLRHSPDAARDLAAGACESGFDHYCRGGYADPRRPHWLFDAGGYLARYPGLDAATLRHAGLYGLYDHFLKHGDAEGRAPGPFFQPGFLQERGAEAYAAFLADPGLRNTGPWFDAAWYAHRYPDVAAAIADRRFTCPLHHYLTNAQPTAFDPLAAFSEAHYLACNPDVAAAVRDGSLRNGYAHFMASGAAEQRSPHPAIDLRHYVSHYADVRRALESGEATEPFTHFLRVGRAENRHASAAARADLPDEVRTKALFRAKAAAVASTVARAPLDFTDPGPPALSVILVVHEQFALTLQTLASLRASTRLPLQVVLVDSASADETRFMDAYVRGAVTLRFDSNIGFVRGCNAGLTQASAATVLFLNNDVVVAPGAPDAALARLAPPGVGAVGARIVRTHGLMQEAGCYLRADGSAFGAGRDLPATHPDVSYARDADYVSGAFLMARTDLLRALDGFDDAYAPAYYEDADLCARIRARGLRVLYEPAALIEHLEYGSAAADIAAQHRMDAARAIFRERHAAFLSGRTNLDTEAALIDAAGSGPSILLIEDQVPLRRLGSGFVRSNDILAAMASLGCRVTVLPVTRYDGDPAALDLPATVCCLHDRDAADLDDVLARPFDAVWVARTHNFVRLGPVLRAWRDAAPGRALILDTEAVAAVRDAARAARDAAPFDLAAALAAEFKDAAGADRLVATTAADAALLGGAADAALLGGAADAALLGGAADAALLGGAADAALPGGAPAFVLGHFRAENPTPEGFAARHGMLFVGAIHAADSPNYDSLAWFVDDVLPRIEAALGWRTRLTIAGHLAPGVTLARFAEHPRVTLRGAVADLTALYDQSRVLVAPTRYAGGAPYKVHEAASRGLPVVATTLLADQLGWHAGELLAARPDDPAAFAQAVLRAHEDQAAWEALRTKALARIGAEHGFAAYRARVAAILALDPDAGSQPEIYP